MTNQHDNVREALSQDPIPRLPPPPSPSKDNGISARIEPSCADSGALADANSLDIFTLTPIAALKLLCKSIENLIKFTGHHPPTPPESQPTKSNLAVMHFEKENVSHRAQVERRRKSSAGAEDEDGVPPKAKTPIGSPEAHPTEPLHDIGANVEHLNIQHSAIARKFYSKKPPLISLEEYLLRLHKYCPMSTAVYLATSLYIDRLALVDKIIPVTSRNVHRLVLAGLRVSVKALEDQSYPHRRFAKVGGVTEPELGRLEISFCFITNFELRVNKEMLLKHAQATRDETIMDNSSFGIQPNLPPPRVH